jgi:hypothetical protein
VVLEDDDGDEEAFRWSKLSSSLDVRWTDAFVLVVGLDDAIDVSFRDRMVVVAREEERSRVVGDGGNADGANDVTRHDDAMNNARGCGS